MSFLRGPLARRLTLISIALLVLSGCVSVRAYPDPGYSQPSYRELRRPLLPGKIAITAEFRTLGSTNSEVSRYLLDRVVKILYASGLFESVTAGPTSQGTDALAIMIDNYSQPDFGEGFRAGYTSRGKEPSLAYCQRTANPACVAVAYDALAWGYLDMGEQALGKHFHSQTLEVAKQYFVLGERPTSLDEWGLYATILSQAMELAAWDRDRPVVVELGDRLEAVLARYALPQARLVDRLRASAVFASIGDLERARRLIQDAQRTFVRETASDPRWGRPFATVLVCANATVTLYAGEYRRAVAELEACVARYREYGYQSAADTFVQHRLLGRAYEELGDLENAVKAYSVAADILERGRASFRVHDRTMFFQNVGRLVYWGLIRASARKAQQTGSSEAFLAALQAAERLRARQLGEVLGTAAGELPWSIERLRQYLGPEGLLLYYTFTEEEMVLLGLTAEEHVVTVRRCPRAECEAKILGVAASLADFRSGDLILRERLAEATDLLLAPVEHLVRGKRRIVVVLDGVMNVIPFDVLYRDSVQQFPLVLDTVVSVLPALAVADVGAPDRRPERPVRVFALGDPEYGGHRAARSAAEKGAIESITRGRDRVYFAPLPETRSEVAGIQTLFGDDAVTVLLGANASESAVKAADLERFQYLHFATHGILGQDVPGIGEPALVLATEAVEDGFLTASEVEQLRLNADLTVLSACSTGLGPIVTGEGVIGLARAFLAAGSRAVVVSLWSVESKATELLMRSFYSAVKAGHSAAEALRLAKLEAIAGSAWETSPRNSEEALRRVPTQYGHPYFWAGFIAVERR